MVRRTLIITRLDAARAAAALASVGAGDEHVLEAAHAAQGVVAVLLHAPRVHHEPDVVDGDGGLRDVRGQHHLAHAAGRSLEHQSLVLGGHGL